MSNQGGVIFHEHVDWVHGYLPSKFDQIRSNGFRETGFSLKKPVFLGISDNAGNINTTLLTNLGLFWLNGKTRLSIPRMV